MNRICGILLAATLIATGCQQQSQETTEDPAQAWPDSASAMASDINPLLTEWTTPFGVPPFDQIRDEHYMPALRAGMEEHKAEIDAIANKPDPATFVNTIVALETAGRAMDGPPQRGCPTAAGS